MRYHSIRISGMLVTLIIVGFFVFSSVVIAEGGKWTKKADMPTARSELSTSVVNGKIYAIGGSKEEGLMEVPLSKVEEYDTGFSGEAEGIEAKEKFVTSWGQIKAKY